MHVVLSLYGNARQMLMGALLQVLGLIAVTATTIGSLYLLDTAHVASKAGLNAVGILLLILNIGYLLLAAPFIASAGYQATALFIGKHFTTLKPKANRLSNVRISWQDRNFGSSLRRRHRGPLQELAGQGTADSED